jgi:hypothetical protein
MLFGLAFVAGGAFVEWKSFAAPEDAPVWVVRFAGLIFILPGFAIFVVAVRGFFGMHSDPETARLYRGAFMAALLWLFAIAFGGAALFGEAHSFSGGVTGSSTEGRILFGIAGVAIGIFAFMFSVVVLGAVMARNQKNRAAKPADPESAQNG